MEPTPTVSRPKGLLIATWIVSILTLVLLSPILFIVAVFSADNSSGEISLITYLLLVSPLVYVIAPIVAQVLYKKERYRGARITSYIALAFCIASFGYLASVFFGA